MSDARTRLERAEDATPTLIDGVPRYYTTRGEHANFVRTVDGTPGVFVRLDVALKIAEQSEDYEERVEERAEERAEEREDEIRKEATKAHTPGVQRRLAGRLSRVLYDIASDTGPFAGGVPADIDAIEQRYGAHAEALRAVAGLLVLLAHSGDRLRRKILAVQTGKRALADLTAAFGTERAHRLLDTYAVGDGADDSDDDPGNIVD